MALWEEIPILCKLERPLRNFLAFFVETGKLEEGYGGRRKEVKV
jgi:hypothetical protein